MKMLHLRILPAVIVALLSQETVAFSTITSRRSASAGVPSAPRSSTTRQHIQLSAVSHDDGETDRPSRNKSHNPLFAAGLALSIATTLTTTTPAQAYVPSDYASDTVQTVISDLKQSSGNVDATFRAYETVAGIITEGKGVGGMVNYKGVQLDRGYVADEDTSIYNPGLTLLTESEKERLVEAVISARKQGLSKGQWSENNEFAFDFLREKLDPFHLTELRGFLSVAPYYAGVLYLGVLGVQQFARGAFQIAYLVGAAAFFLPIVALIAAGV